MSRPFIVCVSPIRGSKGKYTPTNPRSPPPRFTTPSTPEKSRVGKIGSGAAAAAGQVSKGAAINAPKSSNLHLPVGFERGSVVENQVNNGNSI